MACERVKPKKVPSRKLHIYRKTLMKIIIGSSYNTSLYNLMFFWPCIMNLLYINYQLWCTDYYLFIKYYSPLHVSSLKCSSSGGYSRTHAAYGTVTLYESSWWPVGTQLEWELTGGGRFLVGVWRHPPTTFPLHVYNCILLKMSTWCSKHVEKNSILWINNNQCIKVGN